MTTSRHSWNPGSHWWDTSGSLRARLLRLDGQVGAVVNAEKHGVDPVVVSGEVAGQLGRLVQQMDLGAGDGAVVQSGRELGFEPIKPGFTREAGSFRRQGSPQGTQGRGE